MATDRPVFSLRARLLLVMALALAPAFAILAYSAWEQRQDAAAQAIRNALHLVRTAAEKQNENIAEADALLRELTVLPALGPTARPAACPKALADLLARRQGYLNLGAIRPDGTLRCSALPTRPNLDLSDRAYFQGAMATRRLAIGEYQIGRATGKASLNLGYPMIDGVGRVQGVLFVAMDLSWLNRLFAATELPAGSTLTLVDGQGTVLARHPPAAEWAGRRVPDEPLIHAMLAANGEGTLETNGLDGVRRLYAFAPLTASATGRIYAAAGIPTTVAFAAAHRALARNATLLAFVAVLALATTWWLGQILIVRRTQALADAAQRLSAGDLRARTGLASARDELGRLAGAFDGMAAAIEQRELELARTNRALRTLSAGNRALLAVEDEASLLHAMCRVAVEVGGYRMAWVGYALNDDGKTLKPMAAIGADDGELERLALTWADTGAEQSPAAIAARTGETVVVRNTAGIHGLQRQGCASCIALPLRFGDDRGAMLIDAAEPDAFGEQEVRLFEEMAADLSFGIRTARDRDRHREAEEHIRRMAYFDPLTELPNRAHLEQRLHEHVEEARRHGHPLALLLLDIDRFQDVKDALGQHQADAVLKTIGARLRAVMRSGELLARIGEDDFVFAMPHANAEQARAAAARMLEALREPVITAALTLDVQASVGIALFPGHGTEVDILIRRAYTAMQQARAQGGCTIYTAGRDEDGVRRLALAGELHRAIDRGALALYCQAKIDLRRRELCGAEALVRWPHPTEGMIPPAEFIPLAEKTGLIRPLTYWVLEAAARQAHDWRQAGLHLPLAVNLSARNLRDAGLLDRLRDALATWGTDVAMLQLEITESAIMDDPAAALDVLARLSDAGFVLYIDDFGTGYSSLGYLKRLPVDAIKIDKSFILDMPTDPDSARIVRSTIDLAHDMELKVVAEGVETGEILEQLAAFGCDEAQGYHIGRPLAPDEFIRQTTLIPANRKLAKG